MVAIVRKLFSRSKIRRLPHYAIALYHDNILGNILPDNPLTPPNKDTLARMVADLDKIDKRVRTVLRMIKTGHIDDIINLYA
jgi:hypothetical protein